MENKYGIFWIFILFILTVYNLYSQSAPAAEENIPYLVTFGANADKSWGDDDFCQIFFFRVPMNQTEPIYVRVFDPDRRPLKRRVSLVLQFVLRRAGKPINRNGYQADFEEVEL